MSKITLTNLVDLQNETTAVAAINNNNFTVTKAFDNTISRDGTSPNTMNAAFDMNGNRILNLPDPTNPTDPVNLKTFNAFTTAAGNVPAGGTTGQSLVKTSNASYATGWGAPTLAVTGPITITGSVSTITAQTGTGTTFVTDTTPTVKQPNLVGTTTNDAAAAGSVGEYLFGVAPGLSITFTVTIATPAVFTQTGHGYSNTGVGVFVPTTSGALPTGLTAGTTYYTIPGTITSTTFQVATSVANAFAGTAVNTTGTQSGTHTGKSIVNIPTATSVVVSAIRLTAGDWDVYGLGTHNAANTTSIATLNINASLTLAGDFAGETTTGMNCTFPTTGTQNTINVLPFRVSVPNASTQIVYMILFDTFTVSTMTGYGTIKARRKR